MLRIYAETLDRLYVRLNMYLVLTKINILTGVKEREEQNFVER